MDDRLLESKWQESEHPGRPPRHLYRLTARGWEYAKQQPALLILPASGKEWAQAMLAEFYYIEREDHALTWAFGCVIAAVRMRCGAMLIGNLKVSRWVLGLELILCFNPLTFAWLESLFWLSMTNLETSQHTIRNAVQPMPFVILNFSTVILGTLGPLSLIVGFRSIFLRDHFPGKFTRRILFAGPLPLLARREG